MTPKRMFYTDLQAEKLLTKIDKQAAKVCAEIAKLEEIVEKHIPDGFTRTEWLQKVIQDRAGELRGGVLSRRR